MKSIPTQICSAAFIIERYIALLLTAPLFVTSVLCLCVLSVYHAGTQTRDVDPMSRYCWPTVYDAEQTLAHLHQSSLNTRRAWL